MVKRLVLLIVIFWGGIVLLALLATYAHAEPVVRLNVALTCDDIRALAGWQGWPEIERRAREAGASQAAIEKAKTCLSSR